MTTKNKKELKKRYRRVSKSLHLLTINSSYYNSMSQLRDKLYDQLRNV